LLFDSVGSDGDSTCQSSLSSDVSVTPSMSATFHYLIFDGKSAYTIQHCKSRFTAIVQVNISQHPQLRTGGFY